MVTSHHFKFSDSSARILRTSGQRIDITQQNFSVLRGMAISLLELNPKGFREPHWHPNADELSYCMEGRALVTIFGPGAQHDTFTVEPGCLFFVPMGSIHTVLNIGDQSLKMLVCFDHENPEDLNLSSSVAVMPNHVLGANFGLDATFFANLHASLESVFIGEQQVVPKIWDSWLTNRFKFNIEGIIPQIQTKGGRVKLSNGYLLPSLQGLALYCVLLENKGIREPHWHPNAHELNYVIKGNVRITLLSPGGEVDTFEMQAGDISFLPQGYFHDIENIGSEQAHLAVFFSNANPSDIGFSGCLGAYPNELLSSLFNVPTEYFAKLPKYQEDLFVVAGGG